jgi:hypothetical protein
MTIDTLYGEVLHNMEVPAIQRSHLDAGCRGLKPVELTSL